MVRGINDNEKKPLLQREIRADFVGSSTASISSTDYNTYIRPFPHTETDTYW